VVIVACGPLVGRAIDAGRQLKEQGVAATILSNPFINQVDLGPSPPTGSINVTVLNIAGCSSTNNGANPVVGGSGTSPIPVRLITSP